MRFSLRKGGRRDLIAGFVVLMTIMIAHAVMETARDTLFLTRLPATALPRAYLAIALLAIVELKVHERVLRYVRDRRVLLAASLIFGSLITLAFWALLGVLGPWAPFGFYVWTGLLITVVLVEFWLLLDDAVTVTQAKRMFPAVAAGGVTGAMLGSALAEATLRLAAPEALVALGAAILAIAAGAAFSWKVAEHEAEEPTSEAGPSLRSALRDSYLSRVLCWVLLGTIALTVVDFVFKSAVAQSIPTERLGPFFARFYLGLNTVALVVQVVGAGWLLRGLGAHRSSALLPILILGGAMGLIVGPVLPFAVALKAVDGSFRHTLYRSSVELLFLPLGSRRRQRAKAVVEVFGHRGGQAVASLLIIGAVALGLSAAELGFALLVMVAGWLVAIFSTRRQYVDEFRLRLRQAEAIVETVDERLVVDETFVDEQLQWSLQHIVRILQRRAFMDGGTWSSRDVEQLRMALGEEERATLERAFWLMGLRHPEEDFALVWRGLRSDNPRLRAASVEVLEAVLAGRLRDAVLALVDDSEPPSQRARIAAAALGMRE